MYDCHYYWLFAPHRGGVVDNPDRTAAFDLLITLPDTTTHQFSLFCDEKGFPHFARLTIQSLDTEKIPEDFFPTLQAIKEHILVVLRFTYRSDLILAEPGELWSFGPSGKPAQVSLLIEDLGQDRFAAEEAKGLFVHAFNMRETFRLYADGVDSRIPLQYRFLSFYKLLELKYKEQGYWRHQDLKALLRPFASSFASLGYTKEPLAVLHDMRDRCAHIRTGKDVLGVTHLHHAAAVKVSELLPIMRAICATIVNERAQGKFALHTSISEDR